MDISSPVSISYQRSVAAVQGGQRRRDEHSGGFLSNYRQMEGVETEASDDAVQVLEANPALSENGSIALEKWLRLMGAVRQAEYRGQQTQQQLTADSRYRVQRAYFDQEASGQPYIAPRQQGQLDIYRATQHPAPVATIQFVA